MAARMRGIGEGGSDTTLRCNFDLNDLNPSKLIRGSRGDRILPSIRISGETSWPFSPQKPLARPPVAKAEPRSADGKIDLQISPPGSHGPGTNPEQLFAAGYSACFGGAIGARGQHREDSTEDGRHQGHDHRATA